MKGGSNQFTFVGAMGGLAIFFIIFIVVGFIIVISLIVSKKAGQGFEPNVPVNLQRKEDSWRVQ